MAKIKQNRLVLIDASSFCYRAFYAIKDLSTSSGQPTNAIYGFINMIRKVLDRWQPEYVGICFDVSRDTFRQKKFKEYKIQRKPMPDSLKSQMPFIQEIISAYNFASIQKEGFEADDIIATLAKRGAQEGLQVIIVSTDKDVLQLVDKSIYVFNPYKQDGFLYSNKEIIERFGVDAKLIPDVISLMGDGVDNIPGVPGVGEKTASRLIKDFKDISGLLSGINKIKQDKLKKMILEHQRQIELNRQLIILNDNVSLDISLDDLKVARPDTARLFKIFQRLEFGSLLKNLSIDEGKKTTVKTRFVSNKDIDNLCKLIKKSRKLSYIVSGERKKIFLGIAGSPVFEIDIFNKDILNILQDINIKKVTYDLKKTTLWFLSNNIKVAVNCFDVMIAAYLINPGKPGYEFKDIAFEFLGKFVDLNSKDALILLLDLEEKLTSFLKKRDLVNLFYNIEIPLSYALAQMELYGVGIDLEFLKKISKEISLKISKLVEQIYEISGAKFNINSPKQLRTILFDKLKLPVIKKTKTGPSTNEEVLGVLATQHKLPQLLLDYRQVTKLKSTYIDSLPQLVNKKTKRIHTFFKQTGTQTGRLASQNPNLQNIPIKTDLGSQIRKAFMPSGKDKDLISADYSQIELRILAHLSGDRNLMQAFINDEDIHSHTASLIYGIDQKDVTAPMRSMAKRVNFGIIYGITSYGLARDLGISPDEAQNFIDTYFTRYPKVKDYMQEQISFAQKHGYVATLLGRRRYLPEINSRNNNLRQFAFRQAINTPIQGLAADIIKLAMVQIYNDIQKLKFLLKMILQVHDELLFEVESKQAKQTIEFIRDKMENVYKLSIPIRVDIRLGKNWLEMENVR